MSRTLRTPHPSGPAPVEFYGKRKAHLFNKGVKTYGSTRCGSAIVDRDGNTKLNTYDDTKGDGKIAKRQIRRQGKVQITRQLED